MHILYIHQHFCTNKGSGGTRSYDVSRHLVSLGHRVTILCGIADRCGLTAAPWHRPFTKYHMDGFDIIATNIRYSNKQGFAGRAISFLLFAFLASIASLFIRRVDIVFATHTPLTVGIPGYITGLMKGVPFIFEVRDLWPESDVVSGNLRKGSISERTLALLERFLYATANKILLVSPGFEKRLLERGYPQEKLKTILLGADSDMFKELKPDREFRRKHNLEGKTIAVYTGVHGRANGLYYILDAAECLKARSDIAFLFVGDGMEKQRLVKHAEEIALTNVCFVGYVPKTELPGILAVCNIGLMNLADVGERPVTPNKIFDYMFAGLPSIVNFPGPTRDMVLSDKTGVFADPKRPKDLAEKVVQWADHPEEAKATGARARKLAFEKYDRRKIAEQLAETFQQVYNEYYFKKPH